MSQSSSRSAKIAGVAALAGVMAAVAIVAVIRPSHPQSVQPPVVRIDARPTRLTGELNRCSTLARPDVACAAAWAENRRHFFGQAPSESAAR